VPVTLIYCVRTSQDIIFQQELTRLSHSLARFRYIITLSAPDAGWKGNKGRLNKEFLLERISDSRVPAFSSADLEPSCSTYPNCSKNKE